MVLLKLSIITPIFFSIFTTFAIQTSVVLDLNQTKSNDNIDVVENEHYGLSSLEYYPKKGFEITKVVQGDAFVWQQTSRDIVDNAILYYGKEPLSLLYIRVIVDHKEVLKYYVKVSGEWKEVLESVLKSFFWIDRQKYTEAYLNKFAEEYIANTTAEMLSLRVFLPQTFQFIMEPHYKCELDILEPNTAFIMVQNRIGPTFGQVYTPRTEFGIMTVRCDHITLWTMPSDHEMCSSVFVHYKGDSDELIVVNVFNFRTGATSYVSFRKNNNIVVELTSKELLRWMTNMTLDEYTAKDIARYKDGYLQARDFAYVVSTLFAIMVTVSAVFYNL